MSDEKIRITPGSEDPSYMVRAAFTPDSLNEESRTIDAVVATEAPLVTYIRDGWEYKQVNEILICNAEACDLKRYQAGAPLLDNHVRYEGTKGVLGITSNPRFENNQLVVTVRFDRGEHGEEAFRKVKDGILKTFSVGYRVWEYEVTLKDEGRSDYRAAKWEPMELSLAPIPADHLAQVRSAQVGPPQTNDTKMSVTNPTTPTTEAPAVDADKIRKETAAAERIRVAEIMTACRTAEFTEEQVEKYIAEGTPADQVRKDVLAAMNQRQPVIINTNDASVKGDESLSYRAAAESSILVRAGKGTAEDKTRGADLTSYRLIDIARDCIVRSGGSWKGLTESDIFARASSSTSDFPVILQNVVNRVLLQNYALQPDTWSKFCKVGSVTNFLTHHRIRRSSLGDLQEVQENGEYKVMSIPDGSRESIYAKTKGGLLNISRPMLINDDLGAFNDLAADMGRAAKRTIENDVFTLLLANPTMGDGVVLFHANHGNIGTGSALTVTGIDADRVLMTLQKDGSSNEFLSLSPKILLVPSALLGVGKVVNNSTFDPDAANKLQRFNMVGGLFREIVESPRISGTTRYLFEDPMIEPVIEVAFLNGEQNPYFERSEEFRSDGVWFKIRHDYGVGAIGYKGVVRNAGA